MAHLRHYRLLKRQMNHSETDSRSPNVEQTKEIAAELQLLPLDVPPVQSRRRWKPTLLDVDLLGGSYGHCGKRRGPAVGPGREVARVLLSDRRGGQRIMWTHQIVGEMAQVAVGGRDEWSTRLAPISALGRAWARTNGRAAARPRRPALRRRAVMWGSAAFGGGGGGLAAGAVAAASGAAAARLRASPSSSSAGAGGFSVGVGRREVWPRVLPCSGAAATAAAPAPATAAAASARPSRLRAVGRTPWPRQLARRRPRALRRNRCCACGRPRPARWRPPHRRFVSRRQGISAGLDRLFVPMAAGAASK